jgi:hypothetical protein
VAAPELNSARRRVPGPCDTWQHWSSPQQGGEVWGRGTHGSSGAHLYREVWSEAIVAWQRVDTRLALCLDLELICRGTRSLGCRQRRSEVASNVPEVARCSTPAAVRLVRQRQPPGWVDSMKARLDLATKEWRGFTDNEGNAGTDP